MANSPVRSGSRAAPSPSVTVQLPAASRSTLTYSPRFCGVVGLGYSSTIRPSAPAVAVCVDSPALWATTTALPATSALLATASTNRSVSSRLEDDRRATLRVVPCSYKNLRWDGQPARSTVYLCACRPKRRYG